VLQLEQDVAVGASRFLGVRQGFLGERNQAIGVRAILREAGHADR
jgi:hypothetical protein